MSIPTNKFQSVYLNPYVKPSYSFLSIILINVHILHALSQYNASTQNSWIDIIALSWLLPLPLSSPLDQTRPSLMEREPNSSFQFPPGFRFHPSDEELIVHYLQKKVTSHPLPASVIAEIDLYKYNPWELPSLSCTIYSLVHFFFLSDYQLMYRTGFHYLLFYLFILTEKALFGEEEWYFFSPRDRKYPNGVRPNRAAASGFWKATGTDKPILTSCGSKSIGVKKALVFYIGRPPRGVKTEWIMNEYRLLNTMNRPGSRSKGSMRVSTAIMVYHSDSSFFISSVIKWGTWHTQFVLGLDTSHLSLKELGAAT